MRHDEHHERRPPRGQSSTNVHFGLVLLAETSVLVVFRKSTSQTEAFLRTFSKKSLSQRSLSPRLQGKWKILVESNKLALPTHSVTRAHANILCVCVCVFWAILESRSIPQGKLSRKSRSRAISESPPQEVRVAALPHPPSNGIPRQHPKQRHSLQSRPNSVQKELLLY